MEDKEKDIKENIPEENQPVNNSEELSSDDTVVENSILSESEAIIIPEEESVSEELINDEPKSEEIIPDEIVSEGNIPDEIVPEEIATEEIVVQEPLDDSNIQQELVSEEIESSDSVSEEVKEENAIPEEKIAEEIKIDDSKETEVNDTDTIKEEIISETTGTVDISVEKSESDSEKTEDEELEGDFKWYAVRIISGHEKKVKAYLDFEIKHANLESKIKNVLIPLEKVVEVKNGKKRFKMKNFLPGYILIEANLDDQIRHFISMAPSIINMVGSKSVKGEKLQPISLRETEIKRIKAILNEDNQSEKVDLKLTIGDPVKVTSGPFNNFSGNVLDINTEKMKLKVMVSIFGRKTPIELEFTQVEKEK